MEQSGSSRAGVLERLEALERSAIEPGVILARRYCVIGPMEEVAGYARAPVTDLSRSLGAAPHHRLILYIFEGDATRRARLVRAVRVSSTVQPAVLSLLEGDGMLGVVTTPVVTSRGSAPPPRHVALALAELLADLHACDVTGVRFHPMSLSVDRGAVRLADFAHLALAEADRADDLDHLVEFLRQIEDDALRAVLDTKPASAVRLRELLAHAVGGEQLPWSAVLPAEPPFVGRQDVLEAAIEALKSARVAQPTLVTLVGMAGVGKSRALHQVASELSRGGAALVLRAEFDRGAPPGRHGLFAALDGLAETGPGFDERERDALIVRLHRAMGPLAGLVRRVAPRLAALLGDVPEPPEIALGEDFTRQVSVLSDALAAIGTPHRPAMLLIDNVGQADHGSLAVLGKLLARGHAHHSAVIASTRCSTPAELGAATRSCNVSHFEREELCELLEAALPGKIVDVADIASQLLRSSDGLALAAWPILQSWIDEGRLQRDEAGQWRLAGNVDVTLGGSVLQLYDQRLAGTSEDERWLLVLSAVFGGPLSSTQLEQLTEWPSARVQRSVDSLLQRGLLVHDERQRVRFCHNSVQARVLETFADSAPAAHARKLALLGSESSAMSLAHRAYHAELAELKPGPSEELAALHLEAGSELLGIYDLDRARWHFEAVVRRCDDDESVARALEGAASIALLRGRVADASLGYALAFQRYPQLEQSVLLASRVGHVLMWHSALLAARTIISVALRRVGTPLPSGGGAKLASIIAGFARVLAGPPRRLEPLRESLCNLYPVMIAVSLISDPPMAVISALRAARLGRGQATPGAALALSFWASLPACLGMYRIARRLFDVAEERARACGDDWTIGVVLHMRAQTLELARGDFADGIRMLDESVASHRRTGDLSVAALSLLFKAAYGQHRESCEVLQRWLTQAQEAVDRQEQALPATTIAALSLLVDARRGIHDRDALLAIEQKLVEIDEPLPDLALAYAYAIQARVEFGDLPRARELSQRALERTRKGPMPAAFSDLQVALALAFEDPSLSRSQRRVGRRARRHVRRRGRSVPALGATYVWLCARRAVSRGRLARAESLYGKLLAKGEALGLRYLSLQAHRALAKLRAAGDVLVAAEHVRRAEALTAELGVSLPASAPAHALIATPAGAPVRGLDDDGSSTSRTRRSVLADIAADVRDSLAAIAQGNLVLEGWSELTVSVGRRDLQLILVNMVLTARDVGALPDVPVIATCAVDLDGRDIARLSDGRPGKYVRFEIRGDVTATTRSDTIAGMRGCRHAAARVGGFLDLERHDSSWRIAAYLPRGECQGPRPEPVRRDEAALDVVLIVDDDRMRETVAAALERFQMSSERCVIADHKRLASADVAFVDASLAGEVGAATNAIVIPLRKRGRGRIGPLELGVPFTFDELEALLADITTGRAARPE